jgi:probable F420-dependent oxidoreductase
MTPKVKIGVQLVQGGDGVTYEHLRGKVREIDDLGTDVIFCYDHFNPPSNPNIHPVEGISATGEQPDRDNFEAWTTLAAWAEQTSEAEIGTLVTGVGYRNPDLLADMARTVDHISGGRLILGVGAGWYEPDYRRYGYEFGTVASRMKYFEECLERIKNRLEILVPPARRRIPILIGGGGEKKTLPLVAKYADIWHYFDTPETLAHKNAVLDRHLSQVGRSPAAVQRSQEWVNERMADTYAQAGVSLFTLVLWSPHDLEELKVALRWRDRWNRAADDAA